MIPMYTAPLNIFTEIYLRSSGLDTIYYILRMPGYNYMGTKRLV